MTLAISIEGKGLIANCDAISDSAGGTWSEEGGGTVALSEDVFFIRLASIGGKYASKSGFHQYDIGSGNELDFTATTGNEAGQLIYIWVAMTALGTLDTLANFGLCIRLSSDAPGTSNYMDYLIAGNDDKNGWDGAFRCFVIDPTKLPSRISGTQASIIASVRTMGIWIDCSTSARADSIFVNEISVGSGLRVTGTSTTGWKELVDYCTDYATRGWGMFQQREGINYAYGQTFIGDSASQDAAVSFVDTGGRKIQFGISEYYHSGAWKTTLPLDFSGIILEDIAGFKTEFTDGLIVGTDNGRSGTTFIGNSSIELFFDVSGLVHADSFVKCYGTSFETFTGGIDYHDDTVSLMYGGKIINCGQFVPGGAAILRNLAVVGYSGTAGAMLWDEDIDIADSVFIANTDGTNDPAAIEHPSSAGTPYSYSGLLFSGNDFDVENSSGSAITVNKNAGSDPSTYTGSAVTFSASFEFTVEGLELNTEVTIVTKDTTTVLYHLENASAADGAGKYKIVYTHSGGANVDVLLHHIDFKPEISNVYGLSLPNSDSTAKVKMFGDENYDNPNP